VKIFDVKIFEKTRIPLLTNALKAYSMRHKVIASNIANVATPGYKAQRVSFEEKLAAARNEHILQGAQTHEKHFTLVRSAIGAATPHVVEAEQTASADSFMSGVNSVDIDREMGELAENQFRYRFAARMLANTFQGIQKSIRGQL
jgi:flagellar basal-body rod protein FlgB